MRFVLLLVALLLSGAAQAQSELTPLDRAFFESGRGDAERRAYFDLFLDTTFFIAAQPDSEVRTPTGTEHAFFANSYQGMVIVDVFDRPERLDAFMALRNESDFETVPMMGHEIPVMLDEPFVIRVNPGWGPQIVMGPEVLAWLGDGAPEASAPWRTLPPAGERMESLSALNLVPAERSVHTVYAAVLEPRLSPIEGVRQVWLARRAEEPGTLVLIVQLQNDLPESSTRSAIQMLSGAMVGAVLPEGFLDTTILTSDQVDRLNLPPESVLF
jgi:hypothetical protein